MHVVVAQQCIKTGGLDHSILSMYGAGSQILCKSVHGHQLVINMQHTSI